MPSNSLTIWRTARLPRLAAVEAQCAATPAGPLADANLQALVMLLSAEFQGFCRELYTECGQALAAVAPPAARSMVLTQCRAARGLDGGNPRFEVIREDFGRLEFDIGPALRADLANGPRITALGHLNVWRNVVAHDKPHPPAAAGVGSLSLASAAGWRAACDALAAALDALLYNHMLSQLVSPPW